MRLKIMNKINLSKLLFRVTYNNNLKNRIFQNQKEEIFSANQNKKSNKLSIPPFVPLSDQPKNF